MQYVIWQADGVAVQLSVVHAASPIEAAQTHTTDLTDQEVQFDPAGEGFGPGWRFGTGNSVLAAAEPAEVRRVAQDLRYWSLGVDPRPDVAKLWPKELGPWPSSPRVLSYGGRGVDVALHSMHNPGPDTVFWSKNMNSFVVVADDRGPWVTLDGKRVALISINGIGEIRWTVDRYMFGNQGATQYFGLVPTVGGP